MCRIPLDPLFWKANLFFETMLKILGKVEVLMNKYLNSAFKFF